VLGNPRTIFLASLKYMVGEAYALTREKIHSEDPALGRATSCLDCYGPANRAEAPRKISELAAAYLHEADEWERARREGRMGIADPKASESLRKSTTTFYHKTMKSGLWRRAGGGASDGPSQPDPKPQP
jgi:hypothetical protein